MANRVTGFVDTKGLEEASRKVREQATPAQRAVMDEVQAALDRENAELFGRIDAENQLRAWAKNLCDVTLDMTEIEELRDLAKGAKSGKFFSYKPKRSKYGETLVFTKTVFGQIDRVDRYISVLERTVIDVTNNSQFTALSISGLIKLAFTKSLASFKTTLKRFFTRGNR